MIATSDEAREADRLRTLIEKTAVTAMQATPQTWRMLLSAGEVPAGLRLRLCGGEALPRELADQLTEPGAPLWNLYGPTETTVWSAAGVVARGTGPVEIGPPVDHTRVYVLDERMAPVPVGVVGEVCIAAGAWRAGITASRSSRHGRSGRTRGPTRRARACTEPATSDGGGRTPASSLSAGPITR